MSSCTRTPCPGTITTHTQQALCQWIWGWNPQKLEEKRCRLHLTSELQVGTSLTRDLKESFIYVVVGLQNSFLLNEKWKTSVLGFMLLASCFQHTEMFHYSGSLKPYWWQNCAVCSTQADGRIFSVVWSCLSQVEIQ